MEKNRINDKVLGFISAYIQMEGIALAEFNLSKNLITGKGIREFAIALSKNNTLKKLWLNLNELEDDGLEIFSASLSYNTALEELYLSSNMINNSGMIKLS